MRPLLLVLLWFLPSAAIADDELISIQSAHSAPVTIQRLQDAITTNGWTILSTIDHAALSAEFGVRIPGLELRLRSRSWRDGLSRSSRGQPLPSKSP